MLCLVKIGLNRREKPLRGSIMLWLDLLVGTISWQKEELI